MFRLQHHISISFLNGDEGGDDGGCSFTNGGYVQHDISFFSTVYSLRLSEFWTPKETFAQKEGSTAQAKSCLLTFEANDFSQSIACFV